MSQGERALMMSNRTLSDFAGQWQLTRHITPKTGPAAHFEGTAEWQAAAGGLAYSEQGVMIVTGQPPMQAERRYFWAQDLRVFFEDGRFFHQVPPAGGQAHHWCDPDTYTGAYDFTDWPLFRVAWEVSGPRKDYHSITEYTLR